MAVIAASKQCSRDKSDGNRGRSDGNAWLPGCTLSLQQQDEGDVLVLLTPSCRGASA